MTLTADPEIEIVRAFMKTQSDILLVVMFGSMARGCAKTTSDFDLAVLSSGALSLERRVEIARGLSTLISREVDLIDLATAKGLILSEILTTGKILLNLDPPRLAELLRRLWFDRADFGPLRGRILEGRRRRVFGSLSKDKKIAGGSDES